MSECSCNYYFSESEAKCENTITDCAAYGSSVCRTHRDWANQRCKEFCDFCPASAGKSINLKINRDSIIKQTRETIQLLHRLHLELNDLCAKINQCLCCFDLDVTNFDIKQCKVPNTYMIISWCSYLQFYVQPTINALDLPTFPQCNFGHEFPDIL